MHDNLSLHERSIEHSIHREEENKEQDFEENKPSLEIQRLIIEKYNNFQILIDTCDDHRDEKVRYFCKDCLVGLCAECVVDHARHDFILGDNRAAVQIRKLMQVAEADIRQCAQSYEAILFTTEKKLAEIAIYKEQELKRLSLAF